MKKEQFKELKMLVREVTGKAYTMTYASKSETLHIRVGTYTDGNADNVIQIEEERENAISAIREALPNYTVEKNNKRYSGYINDICITIK